MKKDVKEILDKEKTKKILIIDNGQVFNREEKKGEFFKFLNEKYKVENNEFIIYDYDKFKSRPFIKDYLNRQNTFIEIKYLVIILVIWALTLWSNILFFSFTPWKTFYLKDVKTAIVNEILDNNKKLLTPLSTTGTGTPGQQSEQTQQLPVPVQTIETVQKPVQTQEAPIIHYNIPNDTARKQWGL